MAFLHEELVFGPIRSRRLGNSLGINLMPEVDKICTFNCVYCECGWNPEKRNQKAVLPKKEELEILLEKRLKELAGTPDEPDSITFSGNGEPTLHPEFPEIIEIVNRLRDKYAPKAVTSVLTNGTMIHNEAVFQALTKVDNNIMKIDGGSEWVIKQINNPNVPFNLLDYLMDLMHFDGNLIVQTLFLRGTHNGRYIDNTTEEEVALWLEHILQVNPRKTMIYVIDRETPEKQLEKISSEELERIADKARHFGYDVECFS